jgi:hypothetical protein
MKFTSEDLIKAMGLQVGDRVKVTFKDDTIEEYEIIKYDNGNIILHDDFHGYDDHIGYLLDQEIEILPRPKRVGDLKCDDFAGCDYGCPLMWLCCNHRHEGHGCNISLYNVLDFYEIDDQEIYDLLKARLDKVVE